MGFCWQSVQETGTLRLRLSSWQQRWHISTRVFYCLFLNQSPNQNIISTSNWWAERIRRCLNILSDSSSMVLSKHANNTRKSYCWWKWWCLVSSPLLFSSLHFNTPPPYGPSAEKIRCLGSYEDTIVPLLERFKLTLAPPELLLFVSSLVRDALGSWRTLSYDEYQRWTNGILYWGGLWPLLSISYLYYIYLLIIRPLLFFISTHISLLFIRLSFCLVASM